MYGTIGLCALRGATNYSFSRREEHPIIAASAGIVASATSSFVASSFADEKSGFLPDKMTLISLFAGMIAADVATTLIGKRISVFRQASLIIRPVTSGVKTLVKVAICTTIIPLAVTTAAVGGLYMATK